MDAVSLEDNRGKLKHFRFLTTNQSIDVYKNMLCVNEPNEGGGANKREGLTSPLQLGNGVTQTKVWD